MKIKKGLKIGTGDFWTDLAYGGYLKPEEICAKPEDAERVKALEEKCDKAVKERDLFQRVLKSIVEGENHGN